MGTVTDFGGTNILDFIGFLSDTPNIQSVILSSSGPFGAFQVDAYGLSVAPVGPVPEPGGGFIALAALLACAFARAEHRRARVSRASGI